MPDFGPAYDGFGSDSVRSFGFVGSMSGLPESGHGWAIYTPQPCPSCDRWQIISAASFKPWVRNDAKCRVSRASPVQTAMRNCTRDEGGPFEAGSQVLKPPQAAVVKSDDGERCS